MRNILVAAILLLIAATSHAHALDVFACEPEWGALVAEIGGDAVDVFIATTARQDPHQIQARPALISRLRAADLVVCTGAELEVGWMPVLLRQGANAKVQPGSPGYFEAASAVRLLEVPTRLDRADGDVHAAGNPHIQTDPANIRLVSIALVQRMAEIDPSHAATFRDREQAFRARLDAAMARWTTEATPLKGMAVAVQHKDWRYLLNWLGMSEAATLEPKPGVPPSAGYLAGVIDDLPKKKVRMILYAAYQDPKPSEFVAAKTGIPAVELPFTVGGTDQAGDLIAFYDDTVHRLLTGMNANADHH